MEGRHVGLDFYDLLIEVLYRTRPAGLPDYFRIADDPGLVQRTRL